MLTLLFPGTGSMVAAVATAAGRKPVVLGKPSKFMFEIVQNLDSRYVEKHQCTAKSPPPFPHCSTTEIIVCNVRQVASRNTQLSVNVV